MRYRPLMHPVGPLPASVYWARRLAVLAAATAVTGTTAVAVAQADPAARPDSDVGARSTAPVGEPAGQAVAGAAPESSAEPVERPPDPPAPDAEPAPCGPGELAVRVTADPLEGLAGVPVVVTIMLSAPGPACLVDLGPVAREAEVRSGPDRVWSSEDCEGGSGSDVVVLRPGEPRELTVTWEGRRSAPDCPSGLPDVRPGTYTIVVTVEGIASRPATFRLI